MITLQQGDITKIYADAIVNAANTTLLGGGGVDGAIHRAGGPKILEECIAIRNKQGGCPAGEAVITTGGLLPAKFVIHTVGPVWRGGTNNETGLLMSCYEKTLQLAVENEIETIAFPNISTGIYGFPKVPAAETAIKSVTAFLNSTNAVKQVIFVCFDQENFNIYKQLLNVSL